MDCHHLALNKKPSNKYESPIFNTELMTTTGNGGKPPKPEKYLKNDFFVSETETLKHYAFSVKESSEDTRLVLKIAVFILGIEKPEIAPFEPNLRKCHSEAVKLVLKKIPTPTELLFLCASKFDKKSNLISLTRDVVHYTLKMQYSNLNFENFKVEIGKKFSHAIPPSVIQNNFFIQQAKLSLDIDKFSKKLDLKTDHILIKNNPTDECCAIL